MNFLYLFVTLFAVLLANNKANNVGLRKYWPRIGTTTASILTTPEEISFNKDNLIESSNYLKISQTPYYIDKTVYIRKVMADSRYLEFCAPRRFAKSTFLSMLRNFVSLNITKNGEKLGKSLESACFKSFQNKAVFHDKQGNPLSDEEIEKDVLYQLYFQNYPVIYADFSSVSGTTYHGNRQQMYGAILQAFQSHNYIFNNDTIWYGQYEKEIFYKNYFTRRDDENMVITDYTLIEAFLDLSRKLYLHFDKKVIVLIDEVDAPTTSALYSESFSHRDIENMDLIMKSLLTTICKREGSSEYIEKVVVTSILSMNAISSQEPVNFKRYHFLQNKPYEFLFGFTREEVQARIEDNMQSLKTKIETYDENEFSNTIAAWYDGYKSFSEVSIYNPWAVMNAITKGIFQEYWAIPLREKNFARLCIDPTILPIIYRILNQEYEQYEPIQMNRNLIGNINIPMLLQLRKILLEGVIYERSPFFKYLCETGLLSCKLMKDDKIGVRIPNYEVHSLFERLLFTYGEAHTLEVIPPYLGKKIAGTFTTLINNNSDAVIKDLAKDLSLLHKTMHAALNERCKEMVECLDIHLVEHNFKWALYFILKQRFRGIENGVEQVTKEVPLPVGKGRIDIVLMTDHFTFIIELKHGSNSKTALQQCIDRDYSSIMSKLPLTDQRYMLLGINFGNNKEKTVDISCPDDTTHSSTASIRTITST